MDTTPGKVDMFAEQVYEIFQKISDEDCKMMGFDPEFTRPEWMVSIY